MINAGSPAVSAGLGLFETMLTIDGRPVQVAQHAARMNASCRELGLPPIDETEFARRTTAAAIPLGEAAVRVVHLCEEQDLWSMHATAFAIPAATLERRTRGRAVTLASGIHRSMPRHKLTSYAVCTLALRDARARGADEAIFMSGSGVLEGTATNVFALSGTALVTAPATLVLPGIVRGWVIAEASRIGLVVEERIPTVEEVRHGSFFTGSLTGIAMIREIDGTPCAEPGEAFRELARRYEAARA